MVELAARARARVNHGRWIADCPRRHCANAVQLDVRQGSFHCGGEGGCKMIAPVEWPADADAIWQALLARPVPGTRNWYPHDHDEAVRMRLPHGQSPAELREETREHEEATA